ncbi:MAG TPA: hypothetical protein DHV39_04220 [Verrucomicrobiales bacterium]|nr:hypothetical protein [Verrucomicrobiales bacterium]HCZ02607.1 hypothetical protein [Verrucomicrobiales bacterium]
MKQIGQNSIGHSAISEYFKYHMSFHRVLFSMEILPRLSDPITFLQSMLSRIHIGSASVQFIHVKCYLSNRW